jgi:hypothetical protein
VKEPFRPWQPPDTGAGPEHSGRSGGVGRGGRRHATQFTPSPSPELARSVHVVFRVAHLPGASRWRARGDGRGEAAWGRGRAGRPLGSWGTSAGRCIATRIFLAMGLLLMSEIRRSGVWHLGHRVSIPKTVRNNCDHLMYFGLPLGLSRGDQRRVGGVGRTGDHFFAGSRVRGKYPAVDGRRSPESPREPAPRGAPRIRAEGRVAVLSTSALMVCPHPGAWIDSNRPTRNAGRIGPQGHANPPHSRQVESCCSSSQWPPI